MKAKRAVIGRCPWSIIVHELRHVKLVFFALFNIRFFGKYNNNLLVPPPPQIHNKLHSHCFQFLLGLRIVPRETENNGYAKSFFPGGGEIIMVFSKVANGARFENVC